MANPMMDMRQRFWAATHPQSQLMASTNTHQDSESEPESSVDLPGADEQEERRRVVAESVEPEDPVSAVALRRQDRVEDSEPPGTASDLQAEHQQEPEAEEEESEAEPEVDEATLDAWAAFADEYHDMVEQLPLEVQRAFRLISEMEEDTNKSLKSFQSALSTYIGVAKETGPAHHISELQRVVHFMTQSTRNAGDRFSLASTLYETVDRHIQRLDADLTRLLEPQDGLQDESLQTDELDTQGSEDEGNVTLQVPQAQVKTIIKIKPASRDATTNAGAVAGPSNNKKRSSKNSSGASQKKKKRKSTPQDRGMRQPSASLLATLEEIPATPDEPRYCYCNNVAMGDMVGCDNEDCSREWFHLDCVGMDEVPDGDWYCPACAAARGAGLLSKAVDEGQIQDELAQQPGKKRSQRKSTAASSGASGNAPKKRKR